ncbi:MAG: type IV secretory system conjugative DNA transfer family protein [Oscillospiraceae bacterium]|nr:type IV secretory system conjugative DNA transfer family protein [Oscillospiraceae bacterium]
MKQANAVPYVSVRTLAYFCIFLALFSGYFFNRLIYEAMLTGKPGMIAYVLACGSVFHAIHEHPFFFSFHLRCLIGTWICWAVSGLTFYYLAYSPSTRRMGEEHGSASWGTEKDAAKYATPEEERLYLANAPDKLIGGDPDTILSQHVKLTLYPNLLPFDYRKNNNVAVIGGSGTGKSFRYTIPNILQMHSSLVITDPKGTMLPEVGQLLVDNNYVVKVINTVNFEKSMHFNPLSYIRKELDITKVVTVITENTTGKGEKANDPFFQNAEKMLLIALIGYLFHAVKPSDRTFAHIMDMLHASEVREDDDNFQNPVDMMFDVLAKKKGENNFAVKMYKGYKLSAGKTAKSILVSCEARLHMFNMEDVATLTSSDEMELDKIGDRPTALFIIVSDTDNSFNFIVATLLSQMFNLLCTHADDDCGGVLPIPVRCLLDEFVNCIGKISNFEILISTIRSRGISASIMLQSIAQLKSVYKDDANTILDCCDSLVFLGGKSQDTTKMISETMGKQTIVGRNNSESRGSQGSYSMQDQSLGRDLMDPAEVGKLPMSKALVLMTGEKPFQDDKFDTTKHPNYPALASVTHKPFDLNAYLNEVRENTAVSNPNEENMEEQPEDAGDFGSFTLEQLLEHLSGSDQKKLQHQINREHRKEALANLKTNFHQFVNELKQGGIQFAFDFLKSRCKSGVSCIQSRFSRRHGSR